ncbi:hypothetical protein [Flavobacterium sp.]|uniref:hypothetical protein n=1 Tax=Flavobacterium sp. TaxID=239 RepID=UPI003751F3D0
MRALELFIALLVVSSCKNNEASKPQNFIPQEEHTIAIDDQTNFHQDATYKYENRTGTSGDYQYNYDVLGNDSNGNEVYGTINVEDKYGEGIIINTDKEEIEIEVEWIGYGKLKGTDKIGNEYDLEVK